MSHKAAKFGDGLIGVSEAERSFVIKKDPKLVSVNWNVCIHVCTCKCVH